jgi:hypothetical protein
VFAKAHIISGLGAVCQNTWRKKLAGFERTVLRFLDFICAFLQSQSTLSLRPRQNHQKQLAPVLGQDKAQLVIDTINNHVQHFFVQALQLEPRQLRLEAAYMLGYGEFLWVK